MEVKKGVFRLLFITDTSIGEGGGTERHLKELATRLDPARYSVDVLQLGSVVQMARGTLGAVQVWHMPTGKLLSLHGIGRMYNLFRFIRSRRHDCIISFFENSDILSALLFRFTGVRCILSSRRDTGYRYSPRLSRAYRYIDRCFYRIIAPSQAVFDSLLEAGTNSEKITIIPNGVDLKRFYGRTQKDLRFLHELGVSSRCLLLGIVALLRKEKDHLTLLRALAKLLCAGHDMALLVIGQGEMLDVLKEEAENLKIEERVFFLGRRDDVPWLLKQIDIFVLSSITEGMSNAILEAMAAARPVVATDVGGNKELVVDGETGYLVPVKDPDAMAGAIENLVTDAGLRSSMGKAGRYWVELHYSIDAMVKSYENAIQSGINKCS